MAPQSAGAVLLRWIAADGASVYHLPDQHAAQLAELMEQYHDLPMHLADASLVWLSRHLGILTIATTDRTDFAVYRGAGKRKFRNLFFD